MFDLDDDEREYYQNKAFKRLGNQGDDFGKIVIFPIVIIIAVVWIFLK